MQAVSCTWCIPSSFRKGVFHMHISCSNSNKTASIPMTLMQSLVPKCHATHLMPSWYKTLWCTIIHPLPDHPPNIARGWMTTDIVFAGSVIPMPCNPQPPSTPKAGRIIEGEMLVTKWLCLIVYLCCVNFDAISILR